MAVDYKKDDLKPMALHTNEPGGLKQLIPDKRWLNDYYV
jgi:hypothetical protein